jgi:hypothetical protein
VADVIGGADEFYRLRVTRVDEGEPPDLEWRDDVLYRRPQPETLDESDVWRVEAVSADDDEDVTVIAELRSSEEAHEALMSAGEDLAVMTRSEFERTYFTGEDRC